MRLDCTPPEFRARLGRAMPDYEGRRERLRELGGGTSGELE
jgi:hypothetical protein